MLVLTRKAGEQIVIGNDITITLIEVRGGDVRIGIDAPRSVTVHRAEVVEAVSAANVSAAHASAADEDRIRALLAPAGAASIAQASDDV
ncbi:carbon storage regulator CsrA [Occultella gossypii]|uniref:Translational regulator CsrA n=1 Tax=Occultella gossypii TaxID=2800820 RepID=A0ABS7S960_9MICO|nr:carbon storage regulator CsrA [Occultella gossypii]MBZ2196876.1 carbon storage regulator CsrA [Occultella gossypii]